jgi:hypothetical protein
VESSTSCSPKIQDLAQQPMDNPVAKNILVLYDSDLLFDIIKSNLKHIPLSIQGIGKKSFSEKIKVEFKVDNLALIIVAISSVSKGEPLVSLFNTALINQVGQIPILIVSDRKFDSDHEGQIFHLDFPLDVGELCHRVQTIVDRNDQKRSENNRLDDSIECN